MANPDIVIIGSGIGGATIASGLAGSGASILINPGNYYYVGGNSKFFGAVMIRYRKEDFSELEHYGGVSPAWPFSYDEFEPWYSKAEQLFRVRGTLGEDPTEPFHSI
ncbi:MAG: GMC family oxidoreductase, partial [Mesorhizobium sp.]